MPVLPPSLASFNTQPHEGGCVNCVPSQTAIARFQHTAARRRLQERPTTVLLRMAFQHTAARRRLPCLISSGWTLQPVSTHSRTKAAATGRRHALSSIPCFNTQPHEGGCLFCSSAYSRLVCFNTQPHEGGCNLPEPEQAILREFQHTAARRRLPIYFRGRNRLLRVSTHSRTKAAAGGFGNP